MTPGLAHEIIVGRNAGFHEGSTVGDGGVGGKQRGTHNHHGGKRGIVLAAYRFCGSRVGGEVFDLLGVKVAENGHFGGCRLTRGQPEECELDLRIKSAGLILDDTLCEC